MYCVIQEIETKKADKHGAHKEILVQKDNWSVNGVPKETYSYTYSEEKFDRPIKTSYKISIHESYRKGGEVKKKQLVICTMSYYDIATGSTWIQDYMRLSRWDKILSNIGISEDLLIEIVYKKLDPLIKKIQSEYRATEEFIISERNNNIIKEHFKNKSEFETKYNTTEYNYCYDVFGVLRNEKYLKKIKSDYAAQHSYQEKNQSNYNWNNFFGDYQVNKQSNYTEEERKHLKIIYKAGAMKLHPDIAKDDGKGMQFLNKLKEQWGI